MIDKDKITQVIFEAIDEFNEQQAEEQQLEKSLDTILFGNSGKLNSLGLVNLIVGIEQKLEEEFGTAVTLADERAMSQTNSPFQTIGSLAEYTWSLLQEKVDE